MSSVFSLGFFFKKGIKCLLFSCGTGVWTEDYICSLSCTLRDAFRGKLPHDYSERMAPLFLRLPHLKCFLFWFSILGMCMDVFTCKSPVVPRGPSLILSFSWIVLYLIFIEAGSQLNSVLTYWTDWASQFGLGVSLLPPGLELQVGCNACLLFTGVLRSELDWRDTLTTQWLLQIRAGLQFRSLVRYQGWKLGGMQAQC